MDIHIHGSRAMGRIYATHATRPTNVKCSRQSFDVSTYFSRFQLKNGRRGHIWRSRNTIKLCRPVDLMTRLERYEGVAVHWPTSRPFFGHSGIANDTPSTDQPPASNTTAHFVIAFRGKIKTMMLTAVVVMTVVIGYHAL